jgi:hypothetical protein
MAELTDEELKAVQETVRALTVPTHREVFLRAMKTTLAKKRLRLDLIELSPLASWVDDDGKGKTTAQGSETSERAQKKKA